MKTISIHKAQPVCRDDIIESVEIWIDRTIPQTEYDPRTVSTTWEETVRRFYNAEAKELAEALWKSLPGGTFSALVAEMLEKRASLLRVPFGAPERNEEGGGDPRT